MRWSTLGCLLWSTFCDSLSDISVPSKVLDLLRIRGEEEAASKLSVSIYDTERNEKSKEHREAIVRWRFFGIDLHSIYEPFPHPWENIKTSKASGIELWEFLAS